MDEVYSMSWADLVMQLEHRDLMLKENWLHTRILAFGMHSLAGGKTQFENFMNPDAVTNIQAPTEIPSYEIIQQAISIYNRKPQ